jgi:hypothetical protein
MDQIIREGERRGKCSPRSRDCVSLATSRATAVRNSSAALVTTRSLSFVFRFRVLGEYRLSPAVSQPKYGFAASRPDVFHTSRVRAE